MNKLIKKEESETFERKQSLSDINRIVELVCSFANTKGGDVLVGVSDKEKVTGVDIGKNTIERLTDTIVDNIDSKMANIDLRDLEEKNIIKKRGSGRSVYYILK